MAGLAAAPVGKDAFLEALSNREGGSPNATLERDPLSEGDYEEGEDDADAFHQFLNASESDEDVDPGLELSEATDMFESAALRNSSSKAAVYDGLDATRQAGGVLATYRNSEQLQASLSEQRRVKALERLRRDYSAKVQAAEDARGALYDEEQKLRGFRKQAEAGKLLDPARLGYQKREVSKALARLTDCEKVRDLAELVLHRAVDEGAKSERACAEEATHYGAVAAERHDTEVRRAERLILHDQLERAAVHEMLQAKDEEKAARASEARRHQALSAQRLKGTLSMHQERLQELEEVRETRFQQDAQRLLTLKASVDAVNRQVQSHNEARNKRKNKIRMERAQRKQQLVDDGQNPYEVWRREEIVADKERQKLRLAALNELRSEKLMDQLMSEDLTFKRDKEIQTQKRIQAEDFQREMGNYAKEKKIAAYIRKMTIGNVDVLDPTGTALRIDPSKITVQKTHAFGLGRAPPSEIDKVNRDLNRSAKLLDKRRPVRPDSPDSIADLGPQAAGAEGGGMVNETDENVPEGKIWVPKLTKLEEQYLEAAKERQKQNITSVQRCWGKEFTGDAFLAKPSVITFDDFEVGKRYRQVIEVTNVSLTFNQFKLLPLDDKYKEFFEIEFQPPGRMSAGVTRYITLWFSPKVPENIVTTFPILAKTGRIDFPLRCTTKKTILTITPQDGNETPLIDFGQVLSGESATCTLSVKNAGALSAKYDLEPEQPGINFLEMISWTPPRSEFKAHGPTNVTFTFKPTAIGSYSTTLRLSIKNGAVGDARFEEETRVLLRGSCVDVPIYVEKDTYDLKTCIFGHVFRENVVVHNRRSIAMKIDVEKPHQIDGQLQVNPKVAYIQGNQDQAIQIKFSPKDDFLDKNPQYRDTTRKGVHGAFRIPVKIVGAEQVLPVHTVLVGTMTTNTISFEPSVLNFGRVFVGNTSVSRVTMINESLLPQRYVFTRLPGFLSVMQIPADVIAEEAEDRTGVPCAVIEGGDDGAFGTLLPGERRDLCIAYTPEAATEMNVKMQVKAITGQLCAREFGVECHGQGVAPLVSLSHSNIQLASIPSGSVSKESVIISNCGKVPYTMNLVLPPPEISGLKASPVCVTLAPHQSQRVQIEFHPTKKYVDLLELPPQEPPQAKEGEDADQAEKEAETKRQADTTKHQEDVSRQIRQNGGRRWENKEGRSVHATWKLAFYLKSEGKAAKDQQQAKKDIQVVYLGLSTCVLPPILIASPAVLDFGEVTAQRRKILPLTFQAELGVEPQQLRLDALPESACFTVLSAPRTVSNKPFQLMVEFHPQLVQIYQSSLQVRTQSTQFQVPLRGRGVRPVLKIEPADGVIILGSVTHGKECKDNTKETLTIRNDSPFELCYSLETVIGADPNHTGPSPFTLSPSTGVVEANKSMAVTVTFRPHRPLTVFREKILVNVPNQKEPTFVYLYGHCFKYQTYALQGMSFSPFVGSQVPKPMALLDSLSVGLGSGANAETGEFEFPQAQQMQFSLKFREGERAQYLLVGASVPPGFPSAPQNTPAPTFEFQILQSDYSKYFTVEAPEGSKADKIAKGPVVPGKPPIKVAFKYSPEENAKLTYGDVNLELLGGIGQWITCQVRGVLSGGFVPPGMPPTQELTIELRAYLQQI